MAFEGAEKAMKNETIMMTEKDIYHSLARDLRAHPLTEKIIVVLIKWAKEGKKDGTYEELNHEIGYEAGYSGIGRPLGYTKDLIDKINKFTDLQVPPLNSLVANKQTQIPSERFDYVVPGYSEMNEGEQRKVVEDLKQKVCEYPNWDKVLTLLHLV